MPERLIEICVPGESREALVELLEQQELARRWIRVGEDGATVSVLLDSSEVEALMDPLEARFAHLEGFHAVVLSSEASLPRPPAPEPTPAPETPAAGPTAEAKKRSLFRVSREELRQDIEASVRLDRIYLAMIVLSTIVAATGLARDSAAVVIGAMVIAPLLGPNIAFSLATTLGDRDLARQSLRTGLTGLVLAAGISLVLGLVLQVDPAGSEIALRTSLAPSDIVLALASGAAGALAFTTGSNQASLVGVMVAVALMPPLATAAMLATGGHLAEAARALILLGVNLVCINLAGVGTFLAQGIRPRRWFEEQAARRATRRALAAWGTALAVLTALLVLARRLEVHTF